MVPTTTDLINRMKSLIETNRHNARWTSKKTKAEKWIAITRGSRSMARSINK